MLALNEQSHGAYRLDRAYRLGKAGAGCKLDRECVLAKKARAYRLNRVYGSGGEVGSQVP